MKRFPKIFTVAAASLILLPLSSMSVELTQGFFGSRVHAPPLAAATAVQAVRNDSNKDLQFRFWSVTLDDGSNRIVKIPITSVAGQERVPIFVKDMDADSAYVYVNDGLYFGPKTGLYRELRESDTLLGFFTAAGLIQRPAINLTKAALGNDGIFIYDRAPLTGYLLGGLPGKLDISGNGTLTFYTKALGYDPAAIRNEIAQNPILLPALLDAREDGKIVIDVTRLKN